MSETLDKMKTLISEQLGEDADAIKPESHFAKDLGADSLDIVELIMAFENEFDIEIPEEDVEQITTVQSAVDYIENKQTG